MNVIVDDYDDMVIKTHKRNDTAISQNLVVDHNPHSFASEHNRSGSMISIKDKQISNYLNLSVSIAQVDYEN